MKKRPTRKSSGKKAASRGSASNQPSPAASKKKASDRAKKARAKTSSRTSSSESPDSIAGISSDAVQNATGKGWGEWLTIIDKHGGAKMPHADIAEMLASKLGVKPWWSQMVTVGYEQARGLREKHQKPTGYEISVSKTIGTRVENAFGAWTDSTRRANWLPEADFTIRKATPYKYIRGTWVDRETELAANFYPKGDSKCQVAAQHGKIKTAKKAQEFKKLWTTRLDALKNYLESGSP